MNRLNGHSGRTASAGCALVTGSSRGIGAAIVRALAADGWPVAVNFSTDADGAAAVVDAIRAAGGAALPVAADVSDRDAVEAMFATLEDELGPVLVLVNNAGARHDRLIGGLSEQDWRRVLAVNLDGAFHTIRRALGPMVRARFGRVVNVSTVSASRALAGQAAYAASKAGVEALTRTVAIEVARRGVTVNAVAPGLVKTEFVPEMTDSWADVVPLKRAASPDDIAACVRFLASEQAAYVTGAVVPVDGGLIARLGLPARATRSKVTD